MHGDYNSSSRRLCYKNDIKQRVIMYGDYNSSSIGSTSIYAATRTIENKSHPIRCRLRFVVDPDSAFQKKSEVRNTNRQQLQTIASQIGGETSLFALQICLYLRMYPIKTKCLTDS
jgi:hypothetical protein